MDRLALIGVSHRRGGASALERYQETFADAAELERRGFHRFVPIVTCNRWDLLLSLPAGMGVGHAREKLAVDGLPRPYAYPADGALEQLTRIAASLDSLNPGEDQIMRQVRDAYRTAKRAGRLDSELAFAFDTALRTAKRVRREVELAPLNTSLFSLARPHLAARLAARAGRDGTGGGSAAVAVLGAGEQGALAAKSLADLRLELPHLRLLVVNRGVERARQLARHLDAEHLALDAFLTDPPPLTALVCATPVARLVDAALLRRLPTLELLVDLGIPRNVDAAAAAERGLRVLDVDTLQEAGAARREAIGERLAHAERIVRSELDLAIDAWAERLLGGSIRRLRELYLETIGDLLPPDEAERLAHKFAHVPIKGLRGLAREHGLDAAKCFLSEAGLE